MEGESANFLYQKYVKLVGWLYQTISQRFLKDSSTFLPSFAVFGNQPDLPFGVN